MRRIEWTVQANTTFAPGDALYVPDAVFGVSRRQGGCSNIYVSGTFWRNGLWLPKLPVAKYTFWHGTMGDRRADVQVQHLGVCFD